MRALRVRWWVRLVLAVVIELTAAGMLGTTWIRRQDRRRAHRRAEPGIRTRTGMPQWCLRPPRLPFRQLGAAASYASGEPAPGVQRTARRAGTYFRLMAANVPPPSEPGEGRKRGRPGSLTGVASIVLLVALGVLFLPGPDVWRYLGGTLFVAAAAVLIIGMDRR